MIRRREPAPDRQDGDIIRGRRVALPLAADRAVVTETKAVLRAETHRYAQERGYEVVSVEMRVEILSDPHCLQLTEESRLRPILDGDWGSIRAAIAEDALDRQVLANAAEHGHDESTVYEIGDVSYHFDTDAQEWVAL